MPYIEETELQECPIPMNEIIEYLNYEAPGGEHAGGNSVIEFKLAFLRNVLVNDVKYWIWKFYDEDNTESYVVVSYNDKNEICTSYDESFGLTPEQFINADYFEI